MIKEKRVVVCCAPIYTDSTKKTTLVENIKY